MEKGKRVFVAVGAAVVQDYWASVDDVFVTETRESAKKWIEMKKKKKCGIDYTILEREIENI